MGRARNGFGIKSVVVVVIVSSTQGDVSYLQGRPYAERRDACAYAF